MSYQSIDSLQNVLKATVFSHTKDAKKAAGRALGTIVEIITYYLLREWGLCDYISIERGLPEFGDSEILHNVEFTLHPVLKRTELDFDRQVPLTASKIMKLLDDETAASFPYRKSNKLLDCNSILRNSCLLAENGNALLTANLHKEGGKEKIVVTEQSASPFAMVECKRVGVEEGRKKGPQTIEKAKQGAYVAQMTSALQKIWVDGKRYGILVKGGSPTIKPYEELIEDVVADDSPLNRFVLSIGIVSNHGNWFTAETKNKEMKVLANSYDWLLFLTDNGLSEFVTALLLDPKPEYTDVRKAFVNSYQEGKKTNVFTKTKIDAAAHNALCAYFSENIKHIENWFNVITPEKRDVATLRTTLARLANKKGRAVL